MDARQSYGDGRRARPGAWAAAVAAVLLSALPVAAQAEGRVALVIGNSAYEHTDPLRNPGNDADGMAAALRRLDFEVVLGKDLDLDGFYDTLGEFDEASRGADVTLFFYAGHGLQVQGKNWLAPVDARLGSRLDLERGAVRLDTVLEHMRGTKKLVYLDACRNNPLAGDLARSMGVSRAAATSRGLARVRSGSGTLIGYATAPDDVAADGEGRHSPFTEALLAHVETPGLSVNDMFGEVSGAVSRATGGKQVPWSHSSLGRFYLASAAAPIPMPGGTGTAGGGTATAPTPPPSGDAARAYEAAERLNTVAGYLAFIGQYPNSFEAKLAQGHIDKLEGAKEPLVVAGGDPEEEEPSTVTAPSPEAVEGNLKLSREDRRLVQMGLAAAGYDPGGVDGMLGGKTRRALRAWQASKEVEATGYLTKEQGEALAALGREEAERRRVQAEREAEERRQAEAERKAREEAERRRAEAERKEREAEERRRRAQSPGTKLRDCPGCPELVVVPEGSYRMGSPESESGRADDEGPVRRVTIGYRLAVGVKEVTRGEFARFVSETGRSMGDSCWTYEGGEWEERSGRHWKSTGFSQTDGHPVVCVNWDDAKAYVGWLSEETDEEYRLLSESEWEYVARARTKTARYWGESESGQCRYANGGDEALKRRDSDWKWPTASCDDGYARTSPVGRYEANGFGLHDVLGNVWEWVEDCWNESYTGAPSDGSAWKSGDCDRRVLRGGSWLNLPRFLRSAYRIRLSSGYRTLNYGFRVARTLTP